MSPARNTPAPELRRPGNVRNAHRYQKEKLRKRVASPFPGRKFARLPLNKSDISAILPAGFLDVLREIPNVGEDSDFERIQSESSADLFD